MRPKLATRWVVWAIAGEKGKDRLLQAVAQVSALRFARAVAGRSDNAVAGDRRIPSVSDSDVVASLAITLDGYVCREDGSVDYLEKYPIEEFDFADFVDGIGALIMGSTSYVQAVEWGWMWGDRPTMVLTTRRDLPIPDGADIRFSSMPTPQAIRTFSAKTPMRLWVFGGGRVITDGLRGGAIDTLDVTVMPEAIGSGIPLFAEAYDGPLKLVETTAYANGAVRLVYDTRNATQ